MGLPDWTRALILDSEATPLAGYCCQWHFDLVYVGAARMIRSQKGS